MPFEAPRGLDRGWDSNPPRCTCQLAGPHTMICSQTRTPHMAVDGCMPEAAIAHTHSMSADVPRPQAVTRNPPPSPSLTSLRVLSLPLHLSLPAPPLRN
eukprot:2520064-Rhodomonas_salina.5